MCSPPCPDAFISYRFFASVFTRRSGPSSETVSPTSASAADLFADSSERFGRVSARTVPAQAVVGVLRRQRCVTARGTYVIRRWSGIRAADIAPRRARGVQLHVIVVIISHWNNTSIVRDLGSVRPSSPRAHIKYNKITRRSIVRARARARVKITERIIIL